MIKGFIRGRNRNILLTARTGLQVTALVVAFIFYAHALYARESTQIGEESYEVVALKNNLLYDATLTPNLQLEIRLAKRWTLELGGGLNPFPLKDETYPKWRHYSLSIAPRYWFCGAFNRGFFSFNAAYVFYNVAGSTYPIGWIYNQVKNNRYQGHAAMGGVSAGWHFAISPHFSIELEGGADAGYSWYRKYECKHCGNQTDAGGRWLVLPKVGINLVVPLGGTKESFAKRCDCEKLEKKQKDKDDEEAEDVILPQEPIVEETKDTIIPVEPVAPIVVEAPVEPVAPVIPVTPKVEMKGEQIQRLRNRILRPEESYEPYDINTALSADPRNVFLYFDVNVTKMDRTFFENDRLMDSIMYILGEALRDSTLRITRIQIVGFASFDGRQSLNERLAMNRATALKDHIQSIYDLPNEMFALCNGGESWSELRYHLEKLDFDGRDGIIRIMDEEPDLDKREAAIKNYRNGGTYRYMRDRLKKILRNLGCITIYYENVE